MAWCGKSGRQIIIAPMGSFMVAKGLMVHCLPSIVWLEKLFSPC
jgi:hypothetical protein